MIGCLSYVVSLTVVCHSSMPFISSTGEFGLRPKDGSPIEAVAVSYDAGGHCHCKVYGMPLTGHRLPPPIGKHSAGVPTGLRWPSVVVDRDSGTVVVTLPVKWRAVVQSAPQWTSWLDQHPELVRASSDLYVRRDLLAGKSVLCDVVVVTCDRLVPAFMLTAVHLVR